MGNTDTKLNFRKAVVQLTTKTEPVEADDNTFWDQFWSDSVSSVQDVFALVPSPEIRALREESPSNLATLCYKAVEKIVRAADASCRTHRDQVQVLNSIRLLTRLIPYMFEDPDWRDFFWSSSSSTSGTILGNVIINAVCDLLFCPEFTVAPNNSKTSAGRDQADDLSSIDSCEYIWASGVGFTHAQPNSHAYDLRRRELLRFLETCFSQTMYCSAATSADKDEEEPRADVNKWVKYFTSCENRHALPIFTSLLNTVCGYNPSGMLPYNHLLFNDSREETVEVALQILIITLDQDLVANGEPGLEEEDEEMADNLFLNYLSRIHREEDFNFILKGLTRLLMNPLEHTYLPHSQRKLQFHQELLIFFWKLCEHNRKFLFFVLKSGDVLEVLTPILHHLNDARADQSRVGLMHIGVFILLLLSGERNFGVRLNKPYTATIPMDVPVFTGTHADLLIVVFHNIITRGHQRLQPLFDCLLTILCNVSPYIKSMSMLAACKLLHLLEAFSTPWFLFLSPTNHHLVFFLLEMFNNVIQYQFDGNSNLVYTIIRKRQVLHNLANLPTDCGSVNKKLQAKRSNKKSTSPSTPTPPTKQTSHDDRKPPLFPSSSSASATAVGGGIGDLVALKTSLMEIPTIEKLTEKESAHPSQNQLDKLTKSGNSADATFAGVAVQQLSQFSKSSSPNKEVDEKKKVPKTPGAICLPSVVESQRQVSDLPLPKASSPNPEEEKMGDDDDDDDDKKWLPTPDWVKSWKSKLPLQTIMRLLQVLVPQVEKICIDKGLTDESEILRFLQHGTLVGLLPVPHPILIRKYQPNPGTAKWFRTYMWGVIYLRNTDPPIWYDTDVKLFEIQRV